MGSLQKYLRGLRPFGALVAVLPGATFANVTLSGDMSLTGPSGTFYFGARLDGNGRLIFDVPAPNSTAIDFDDNAVIASGAGIRTGVGGGELGIDGTKHLTNQGLIAAQTQGAQLAVWTSGLLNTGTLSSSGGTLSVLGQLTNQGTVRIDGGTIRVGGYTSTGSMVLTAGRLELAGAAVDVSNFGTFSRSGGVVALAGDFSNATTTDTLTAAVGPWVLANGGHVVGGSLVAPVPGSPVQLSDGTGTLESVSIDADVAPAVGTTLQLQGAWSNNKSIMASGAKVGLRGTGVNHGTVTVTGGGTLTLGAISSTGTLSAIDSTVVPTAKAPTSLIKSVVRSNSPVLIDVLNNDADTVYLDDGWSLGTDGEIFGGVVTVHNGAVPALLGGPLSGALIGTTVRVPDLTAKGQLSILDGLTLDNTRITFTGASGTPTVIQTSGSAEAITGSGEIVSNGGTRLTLAATVGVTIGPGITMRTGTNGLTFTGTIVNQGTISAQTPGQSAGIGATFTNAGLLEAKNGGTLSVGSGTTLTNYSASKHSLTGGTYAVYDNSTMVFSLKTVTDNAATVILSGPNSVFAAISPLNQNEGSFSLLAGRDFDTQGALSNVGTILVGAGSDLTVASTFDEGAAGRLNFEISGASGHEDYGQIAVASSASLDGVLGVSLGGAYTPQVGDTFLLISGGSVSGAFSGYDLPPLPPGMQWQASYTPSSVSLGVVPEPGGPWLMAVGAFYLGVARRGRRACSH